MGVPVFASAKKRRLLRPTDPQHRPKPMSVASSLLSIQIPDGPLTKHLPQRSGIEGNAERITLGLRQR